RPADDNREERTESFGVSALTLFFIMTPIGVAIGVLAILVLEGFAVNLMGLVVAIALMETVGLACTLLAMRWFRVEVPPESISGYTPGGRSRSVAWPKIVAVKPFNFLGLKFLRVFSANALSPVWLPLFLSDQERFTRLVVGYAGRMN